MTKKPTSYAYRGPGHVVEIDDLIVLRDVPCALTDEQLARIKVADPLAVLEAVEPEVVEKAKEA